MTDRGDVWVLVLVPERGELKDIGRTGIARLLKTLGRAYGMKCLKVGGEELLADGPRRLREPAAAERMDEAGTPTPISKVGRE